MLPARPLSSLDRPVQHGFEEMKSLSYFRFNVVIAFFLFVIRLLVCFTSCQF